MCLVDLEHTSWICAFEGFGDVGGYDRSPGSSGFGGIVVMHDVEMRKEEKTEVII